MAEARRLGIDAGASLTKLATSSAKGDPELRTFAAGDLASVAEFVASVAPERTGLTGCGAAALAGRLGSASARINEFAAWGAGSAHILGAKASGRRLVVSVGTGTSVLLLDQMQANRIGGTALGGGTVLGLGAALAGTGDFDELCQLAEDGDAGRVDLRVSDIYQAGEIALSQDATASAFAKLGTGQPRPQDLAAGIMNLVGENVALICAGLAAAAQVDSVAYGGSTLRGNTAIARTLVAITQALGRKAFVLDRGEFTGAIGALQLVST